MSPGTAWLVAGSFQCDPFLFSVLARVLSFSYKDTMDLRPTLNPVWCHLRPLTNYIWKASGILWDPLTHDSS